MAINRRTVLVGGALAAATTIGSAAWPRMSFADQATEDPASAIIAGYRQLQTGIDRESAERTAALRNLGRVAKANNNAMSVAGSGPLWTDLPFGPGSDYTTSMYARLRSIAVDWGTPGGTLTDDPDVFERIHQALDLLYANQYGEHTEEIGNWYTYEIGVPYYLLHILVTVADRLPPAELARYLRPVLRFVGNPNRRANNPALVETGANRADKALIAVVTGALAGDRQQIRTGVDAVTDVAGGGAASVLLAVDHSAGDGFHRDGSFIQHETVPYPGHYGTVLLTALAGLVHVTAGTEFELPAGTADRINGLVADTFAPFVFSGALMEPVRGRMLSRQGETGHDIGHQLTVSTAILASLATGARRAELGGLVAKWVAEDTFAPVLEIPDPERFAPGPDLVAVPGIEFVQQVLATGVSPLPTMPAHRVFGQQDRMVHTAREWSASLGVCSNRIARYESINSMNLHGWYTGDGVLYTFLRGAEGHYSDAYWPTVDPLLLPGTTARTGEPPALEAVPRTPNAHTGGVRLDDRHGAYAMDFVSAEGTLTAKKSWFFTPEGIVCLGAGITDTSGERVRTTVENRNLGEHGRAMLLADWSPVPTEPGREHSLRTAWLHLQGVGGYLILDGADVLALCEDRTGAWGDIDTGANTRGTTTPYTRRYQKLVLDHGVRPASASYAYAVLPGAGVTETCSASRNWRILANTTEVQAIRSREETVLANFYRAGAVGGLSVSGPAAVALWRSGGRWRLAVADPTQSQDSVRVSRGDQALDVSLRDTYGATRTACFFPRSRGPYTP